MQWAKAKGPALLSIVVASKALLFLLGDLPSGVFVLELGQESELREVTMEELLILLVSPS